jgi:hypothetical protein
MKKLTMIGALLLGAAIFSASPVSLNWSSEEGLSVSQDKAYAVVGRPATPGSVVALQGDRAAALIGVGTATDRPLFSGEAAGWKVPQPRLGPRCTVARSHVAEYAS